MNNIAIIQQGSGKYLFSVPDNVALKEGDHVKCDTKRGITDGIAFADSAWVDENVSQLIGKLTGAKFPLKSVVGRLEYLPFEKPEDKPANKYEGMSNLQLKTEMCSRGSCCASNSWRRKHDCLFADSDCHDVTDSDRADVIKYLLAEDAEAAPKPEDKQEPIKLYCVEDWNGGKWLAKGKVYGTDEHGRLVYEDGSTTEITFANVKDVMRSSIGRFLVPLVKRPAEVGEWVLLDRDDCFRKNKQGDVVKVVEVFKNPPDTTTYCFVNDPTREYIGGICVCFENGYSYVLDGYKPTPEAEPEPEYYSGKVICVSSGDEFFTVGKMYAFINGEVKDDEGDARPMHTDERFKSVEDWNSEYGMPIARFIEFKGEFND